MWLALAKLSHHKQQAAGRKSAVKIALTRLQAHNNASNAALLMEGTMGRKYLIIGTCFYHSFVLTRHASPIVIVNHE